MLRTLYEDVRDKRPAEQGYGLDQGQITGAQCNTRPMTDEEKLNEIFTYHPATPYSGPKFEHLREAARHFAKVILLNVPSGADRTCALRHVRDAVMTANAGVSLDGLSF